MYPRAPASFLKCLPIAIASVLFVPVRALSMTSNLLHRVRVELFFKTKSELKDRVQFLCDNGVTAFNLVNKDKKDVTNVRYLSNGKVCGVLVVDFY